MIPFKEFKKLLGPAGTDLSDEEVLHIRGLMERLAGVIFEMWLRERKDRRL